MGNGRLECLMNALLLFTTRFHCVVRDIGARPTRRCFSTNLKLNALWKCRFEQIDVHSPFQWWTEALWETFHGLFQVLLNRNSVILLENINSVSQLSLCVHHLCCDPTHVHCRHQAACYRLPSRSFLINHFAIRSSSCSEREASDFEEQEDIGTILFAERWCRLGSLLGSWAQSWTCRHSDTGHQHGGTHFADLFRMTGRVHPSWY